MTFISKTRGDSTRPLLAEYTCPEHGVFECVVQREENGEAPDVVQCDQCEGPATWTPSAIIGRVRRVEVVRGKYEKPERKTWLDTRNLGEGQDLDDFREDRRKIRDEQREREVREILKTL